MRKRTPHALVIATALFAAHAAHAAPTSTFNLATGIGTGQSSDYSWDGWGILTVHDGADIEITGAVTGGKRIVIETDATASVTLNNVSITDMPYGQGTGENACPLWLHGGSTLNLTLAGDNTLSAGLYAPGIRCEDATLVITAASTGTLTAYGGNNSAGIGGRSGNGSGTIVINGGTVNATGGSGGSGIGSGSNGASSGTITINGGRVTAFNDGSGSGRGIGGNMLPYTQFTLDGGAVVITSSIQVSSITSQYLNGILFVGGTGTLYGNVTLTDDITIPAGYTLTIPSGATLTIPADVILTNYGTITNDGAIINYGGLYNYGTVNGSGTVAPKPVQDSPLLVKGSGWDYSGGVFYIHNGANVVITGTTSNERVEVAANATATITLDDVNITSSVNSPLSLNAGANVTLVLTGANSLTASGSSYAGLQVSYSYASLTIDAASTGSLAAIGGDMGGGAGIGVGGGTSVNWGSITINGGFVTATGRAGGAGIGGGAGGPGGTITINGGVVDANGGGVTGAPGIGGGSQSGQSTTVNIHGGTVTATGVVQSIGPGVNSTGNCSLNVNGNAVIHANSNTAPSTSGISKGILFHNTTGNVYGNVTLADNLTVDASQTLTIRDGAALTIPAGVTLTNNGIVTPADGSTVTADGTVANNKINGANAGLFTANVKDQTSVTLNAASLLAATGQDIEYAYNTVNSVPASGWQDGLTFSGLTEATTYYFFARSKADVVFATGTASGGVAITTAAATPPVITGFLFLPGGDLHITATNCVPGATYAIVGTTNLAQPFDIPHAADTADGNGNLDITIGKPVDNAHFFRLIQE
ncbi:MAG: hypothetical protein FWH21_06920 [Kiritimatiellaeota bacterium]|nr:hypothetical protein [Kiritimatiellota bacterium]